MRHAACVHTLKQLHYESKTKLKCRLESQAQSQNNLKKENGPGILGYLTKESDNYTAFIKQLINI